MQGFQQVWFANSKAGPARNWWGVEGLCLGIAALLFILLSVFTQRVSKCLCTAGFYYRKGEQFQPI